ncbi:MAG TPA: hypothetical protein VGF44_17070, partial [Terriglobales bacterium]
MMTYVLWYLLITGGFVGCVVVAAWMWFHFPERTANDVVDFLLPVDMDKVEGLLDPEAEGVLKRQLSRDEFRQLQRKRIHLYLSFVKRMAHNASVLIDWANREAEGDDERMIQLAQELQQGAVEVRLYSLMTILKLRLWLLLRVDSWKLMPVPSLYDVRELGGIRGTESYDRLKTTAGFLFLEMRQPNFEQL